MISWKQVSSSNISAIRYDESSRTLEVRFNDGSEYQYFDVPPSVYQDFSTPFDGSYGKSFHRLIKGHYRYARV
jgi:hypothetical protein